MVQRPVDFNNFEFATLSILRAHQLTRGCIPRVMGADNAKVTVTAQMEVAERKVVRLEPIVVVAL